MRRFSTPLFSLAFGIAYGLSVLFRYPLFRYNPLLNRVSFTGPVDRSHGPSMSWFGWIAMAALAAFLITALVPKRIGDRIAPLCFYTLVPVMIAIAIYREIQELKPH